MANSRPVELEGRISVLVWGEAIRENSSGCYEKVGTRAKREHQREKNTDLQWFPNADVKYRLDFE